MMTAEFNVRDFMALPTEQTGFLTPESERQITEIVGGFDRFVEGGGVEPTAALVQTDAHSDAEEATRDELTRQLSLAYEVDLETQLNAAEKAWADHANGLITLEAWMKQAMGVQEKPDEASDFNGIRRDADITTQDGVIFGMHEVELPTKIDLGSHKRRAAAGRIIYFSSRPA